MQHGKDIIAPYGYEAARSSAAFLVRNDRRFLRVFGRDPLKMVQGLITNDLASASADRAVYAAMLTPKGRMIADMRLLRRGADILIDSDEGAAENIAANLKKFVPPLFAKSEDVSDRYGILTLVGPEAASRLERLLHAPVTTERDVIVEAEDVFTIGGRDLPGSVDVIAIPERIEALRIELVHAGAMMMETHTFDTLRVEAGVPRWGAELDDSVIPLEAGLRQDLISETKGCYTGQEVIIRILHRGHVNRHLRGLLLGDAAVPQRDTPLFNEEGKNVGMIKSAVVSPALKQTIALAYVRREIVPPADVRLADAAGPAVRVVEVPFQ